MSPNKKELRKKHFTDRAVQGALLLHTAGNWLVFLFTVGVFLFFIEMLSSGPRDAWQAVLRRYAPSLWAVVLLAPIFLCDLVKLSNRFAGPMVRLRREMRNLAEGRAVAPLHFRDGDFWQDLAADFNRVAQRVEAANAAAQQDQSAVDRPDDSPERLSPELARS